MRQARNSITTYLALASRARRDRRTLGRALQALTVLATLLLASLILVSFVPAGRGWFVLALVSVGLVSLGMLLASALRRDSARDTAGWIAKQDSALGGGLGDAVEFAEILEQGKPVPTGSVELAEAHVEQMADRVEDQDPERHALRAMPSLGGRRAAVALLCAAVALLALPRSRDLLLTGVRPGSKDAARYDVVEVRYTYPAYLDMAPKDEVGSGDISAPPGTHVSLTVAADRGLESARLIHADGVVQELTLDGHVATGTLVVVKSTSYRLRLQGVVGGVDEDSPEHLIQVVPDREPLVRLRSPASDLVLDEGEDLDVLYRFADDHGVAALVFDIEPTLIDGSPDKLGVTTHELKTFTPPVLSRVGSRRIAARKLGVSPGKSVYFSLRVRDADVVSGPHWARSERVKLTVRSTEAVREQVDQNQDELAEAMLSVLAGHLVAVPSEDMSQAVLRERWDAFNSEMEELLFHFPRAMESLDSGPEGDVTALIALEDMRTRLRGLMRSRRQRAGLLSRSGPAASFGAALARLHRTEILELEQDVLFFDMWADRRAALRTADSASELMDQVRELMAALGEDESGELDEVEAAEALASAEAVASELEKLQAMTNELQKSMPDALQDPATAEAREQGYGEAKQLLADLEQALKEGRTEDARMLARELAALSQQLSSDAAGMAAQGQSGDPELMAAMEEVRTQMRNLRGRQADLRDKTNTLRDEAQTNLDEEDRRRVEELFEELLSLTDEAIAFLEKGEEGMADATVVVEFFKRLEQQAELQARELSVAERARREGRFPSRAEQEERRELRSLISKLTLAGLADSQDVEILMRQVSQAREQLGRLRQVLADRDLDDAWRPARLALNNLDMLVAELSREPDPSLSSQTDSFKSAQVRAGEVLTKLEELKEQVRQASERALSDAQRSELQGLANQQAGLTEEARGLEARLRELGVDAPFLSEEVGEAVGRAASQMGDAGRGLEEASPAGASEAQGEAMASLDEAGDMISPSGSRRRGGGQGAQGEDGRIPRRERVEIPDADAYEVPREFREEILAAMRESEAPKGYVEQVREYYRRLVE